MDVFEDFIYGRLYLWVFFQFWMSLTPGTESGGGCELQRQFSVETHEGDKCSSMVTRKQRNEWLELFQRCFLEMGQGWESGKPAKRGGFNISGSLATARQQSSGKFADCFSQSKEAQRSCNNKPTGTRSDVSELSALSHLCISKWTVSRETSPCTGGNRPRWLTCCAPSHRLSS